MKSDMTKQKVYNVVAVTMLMVVAAAGAGVLANDAGNYFVSGVQAQGLDNDVIGNTDATTGTNDGASIMHSDNARTSTNGVTATTTSVSVTGDVSRNSSIHTNLTVGFPIEVSVPDGEVRVLIPTATEGAKAISGEAQEGVFILPTEYLSGNKIDRNKLTSLLTCPGSAGGATFSPRSVQVVVYDKDTDKYYDDVDLNAATVTDGDDVITLTAGRHVRYLTYTCDYTGTPLRGGAVNVDDPTDNDYKILVKDLINPKAAAMPSGDADYDKYNKAIVTPARVQMFSTQRNISDVTHMTSDMPVLISTVMQDVLVKARVDYSLTFRVDGVEAGDTDIKCTNKPTVSSSPLKIDYGSASIGTPVDAAQRLFVNSSVAGGYKITMTQNRNMRRQDTFNDLRDSDSYAALCYADSLIDDHTINRDCIPNVGWADGLTADTSMAWDGTGFGYTVAVDTHAATVADFSNTPTVNKIFSVAGTSDGSMVDGGGAYYTRLATRDTTGVIGTVDTYGSNTEEEPIVVAGSEHIAGGDFYDVCYRLSVDGQNNAGVYDNEVTYTITASL